MSDSTSSELLEAYAAVVGESVMHGLKQMARPLRGCRLVHVNSARYGGGVAEILHKMVPLMRELGLDVQWEVISGEPAFFGVTKAIHNGLQGQMVRFTPDRQEIFRATTADNVQRLRETLESADFVVIHDPQPAGLIEHFPNRKGTWIWRCHIDASRPNRRVWRFLRPWVSQYDATIFSLPEFTRDLPNRQYLVAPSIDPLSEKNIDLDADEIRGVTEQFGLDPAVPLVVQVSRFDRFKDPLGVIHACRLVRRMTPVQLALVGGEADDDPEGAEVLKEVRAEIEHEPDFHAIVLPPTAHRTVNALQRAATVIVQKSTREGFGLTVTEGMWKRKPVVGGDTGGIRIQVIDHQTGFLVRTAEGAALRIRYLLQRPHRAAEMGETAYWFAWEHFLLPRNVRDYLAILIRLRRNDTRDRVELWA